MANMISIPLYLTIEQSCSYLDDRTSQSVLVDERFGMTQQIYSHLIERGFRRSGNMVYAPHCQSCSSCIACRVKPEEFKASRSQRRCIEMHKDTEVMIKPSVYDAKHQELYKCYLFNRHSENASIAASNEYMEFFGSSWCDTWMVEFYIENQLAAVAVVDVMKNALSAVYTFYEPKFKHYSLGTYAVLWQIEKARELGMEYVYLGYWVENSQKMDYKKNFRPLELFMNQQWQFYKGR